LGCLNNLTFILLMAVETEFNVQKDDAALLGRLLAQGMPRAAADWIVGLRFPDEWERDAEALAVKNQDGTISTAELRWLDPYVHVGDLLGLLQAEARSALQQQTQGG
jgi:hypothetical protein